MIKAKDLIGKTIKGTADWDTPEEVEGIVTEVSTDDQEVTLNDGHGELEIGLIDITHIDGIPVTCEYEFRAVEMYYGTGSDSGTWDTEYVYIPCDTTFDKVEEVAIDLYRTQLQTEQRSVQIIGVYSLGDPMDGHNFNFDIAFYPCEDVKFIDASLMENYRLMGIDKPSNHDKILEFVVEDVMETADKTNWHSGDVDIAFRRWIESRD